MTPRRKATWAGRCWARAASPRRSTVSGKRFASIPTVPAHGNLGVALSRQGKSAEAIGHFRKALEIAPRDADAHYNLGVALALQGWLDEAAEQYRQALEIDPDRMKTRKNLCDLLAEQRRLAEAVEARYRSVLKIRPDDAATANNLAWLLATCPVASVRNGGEAVELARWAVRVSGGREPATLGTLAAAYAEAGRFPEAVQTVRTALYLATQQNNGGLADALRARIALYEAGTPYRQPPGSNQPRP